MTIASWVEPVILAILLIGNLMGWVLAFNRYSKNEARHMGRLEGKMDGLDTRMKTIEERMGNLERQRGDPPGDTK